MGIFTETSSDPCLIFLSGIFLDPLEVWVTFPHNPRIRFLGLLFQPQTYFPVSQQAGGHRHDEYRGVTLIRV